MTSDTATKPPRAAYASLMAGATVLSVAAAYASATALGGDTRAASFAAAAVGGASIASFIPSLIQTRNAAAGFGMVILGASIARILLLMFVVLAIDNAGTVDRRPFVLGVLIGAALMLIIETAAAVTILKKLDRAGVHRAGSSSNKSEHA